MALLSDFLWRTIVCQPNIHSPEVKKGNRAWEVMCLSRTLPLALLLVVSVHLAQSLPRGKTSSSSGLKGTT